MDGDTKVAMVKLAEGVLSGQLTEVVLSNGEILEPDVGFLSLHL